MQRVDVSFCEVYFQSNLQDWCSGGPKGEGWTRTGPPIDIPSVRLVNSQRTTISVKDALAKNPNEVQKWHIDFLHNHETIDKTVYYFEYLLPRFHHKAAIKKANEFIALFESMKSDGFNDNHPVLVADILPLRFGFRYFRFDGCHRLACAHVLGMVTVPAYLFTAEATQ